jgi:mannose-6-phosphate isomerase-like protein (cupin superfamily)
VGELNGQFVKVVKVQGEFVWHQHDHEDELFLVLRGELKIELEGRTLTLQPGELAIIPKGTQHRPYAVEETHIMLFEPKATVNTGEHANQRTREAVWV